MHQFTLTPIEQLHKVQIVFMLQIVQITDMVLGGGVCISKFVLSKSLHTIIEVHYVEIESQINFPGVGGKLEIRPTQPS